MNTNKIKVGITHGDINGISYEVIIKALMDNRIQDFCSTIVYGSPKVAAYHRKALDIDNFSFNNISSAGEANSKRPNILNCVDDQVRVELGKSTEIAGRASVESLKTAVRDLKDGFIDVLVTRTGKQIIRLDNGTLRNCQDDKTERESFYSFHFGTLFHKF